MFQDDFVTITLKLSKEMAYRVYDGFSEYEPHRMEAILRSLPCPEAIGYITILPPLASTARFCLRRMFPANKREAAKNVGAVFII
jgi:hypothetical protein